MLFSWRCLSEVRKILGLVDFLNDPGTGNVGKRHVYGHVWSTMIISMLFCKSRLSQLEQLLKS